ncbi:hypothetical protein KKF61_07935 [Patescibacteria group bacterium]|nr:hypothetical protein [Patescibacteria group bacterium]
MGPVMGGAPWLPTDIAGCAFFLSGDIDGLSDTDPMGTWPDSEDAHDATQATESKKFIFYTNQMNGHPGIFRDNTDDEMRIAAFTLNQPFTLLAVVKLDINTTPNHRIIVAGANTILFDVISTYIRLYAGASLLSSSQPIVHLQIYAIEAYFNGASSVGYVNNVQAVAGDAGTNNITEYVDLGVTGNPYWQEPMLGHYGEIFGMNGALAGAERTAYYSYLSSRYGI